MLVCVCTRWKPLLLLFGLSGNKEENPNLNLAATTIDATMFDQKRKMNTNRDRDCDRKRRIGEIE